MFSLNDRIPGYLLGKYQLIATVTFSSLFSLVFLLASVPFSHNVWFDIDSTDAFGFTVLFFLIALFVVIVSKRVLYQSYRKRQDMTYLQYILWNAVEIVIICILYTLFTLKGDSMGIIDIKGESPDHIFFNALLYCVMSIAVPYVGCAMYFAIIDRDNTIRVMNYSTVVSDEVLQPKDEKKITLFDNSGVLKLSVSSANLYYIESDDNYIKVWYEDSHGVLKQYMLRCRLKTIEDSFADSSLIRCHRKYIVNMDKVKILSKEKDGYVLELDNDTIPPIQITKTYEDSVLARFNNSSYFEA